MSYLDDFRQRIDRDDYQGFLQLWEEYCGQDTPDGQEVVHALDIIRNSRFAGRFGKYAETALSLQEKVDDEKLKFDILRLVLDLETENSPYLAEIAFEALKKAYADDPYFNDKIRLIGLRNGDGFQGAIRNYELLTHLAVGAFVYHTGGWGTGEVIDVSMVREEIILEFEAVGGRKSLSFENAFANLVKLDKDHFLSRRFGDPDKLEEEARRDPVGTIRDLLSDLGPKSAAEIKEELAELVIPQEEWAKWWQAARSRIKKDTGIQTPKTIRDAFRLRDQELSHADQMREAMNGVEEPGKVLLIAYNFSRDFPEVLREPESRDFVKGKIGEFLGKEDLPVEYKLQMTALLEEFFEEKGEPTLEELVRGIEDLSQVVDDVSIGAFKKHILVVCREARDDWGSIFLDILFRMQQNSLRDYLIRELDSDEMRPKLTEQLEDLLEAPIRQAHLFVWYFQKVMAKGEEIILGGDEDKYRWFEGFLTLMHQLDYVPEYRELQKKMYAILTAKRYTLVRDILKDSPLEFAREFLLLESKCHLLSAHDHKIMQSLAEVAHPLLVEKREGEAAAELGIIWTTKEGYEKIRGRIEEIGTVETVDNAKEIERAREHGDLRENAEYKAALERRSRLQAELKMLSDQLNKARILTKEDIAMDTTGVGNVVELADASGKVNKYTLLGPWDADPDRHILSYQSKLAKAVIGLKVGDNFTYQDQQFSVKGISSYFNGH